MLRCPLDILPLVTAFAYQTFFRALIEALPLRLLEFIFSVPVLQVFTLALTNHLDPTCHPDCIFVLNAFGAWGIAALSLSLADMRPFKLSLQRLR